MNSDVLKVLDLFALDESVVDDRLIQLTSKTEYTINHLKTILCLIEYKYLINVQEGSDCENDLEISFAPKMFAAMDEDNINHICKIIHTSLLLNKEKISFNAEHFLHQIFANLQNKTSDFLGGMTEEESQRIMYWLQIMDSIVDAAISTKSPVQLISQDVALENLLYANNDKITLQLLTSSIPKLVIGTKGYYILDKIWFAIRERKENIDKSDYIILSSLSDFYLPISFDGKVCYSSTVVKDEVFWNMILKGFLSDNLSVRKYALFLAKRALDSNSSNFNDLVVSTHDIKDSWQNFFVLLESLEEKQCNIVLGALPLFHNITTLDHKWVSCALQIALQHESTSVLQEAVKISLILPFPEYNFSNTFPMEQLLNGLNNNFLYETDESFTLVLLTQFLACRKDHLISFLRGYNSINWSPVPRLYTIHALRNVACQLQSLNQDEIIGILTGILKQPCNNLLINIATQISILQFVLKNLKGLTFLTFYKIMETCSQVVNKQISLWDSFVDSMNKQFDKDDVTRNLKSLIQHQNSIGKIPADVVTFMMSYEAFPLSINSFIPMLKDIIGNITDINRREYANKGECEHDFSFMAKLTHFLVSQNYKEDRQILPIETLLIENIPNLILYISKYLSSISNKSLLDIESISSGFEQILTAVLTFDMYRTDELTNLYKMATLCLRNDNHNYIQKYLAVRILVVYSHYYKKRKWSEILDVNNVIFLLSKDGENIDGIINDMTCDSEDYSLHGKLKTSCNEAICELLFYTIDDLDLSQHVYLAKKEFMNMLSNIIYAGGYGCLYWIMKTFKCIVTILEINTESIDFITNFINICWKETLQLKSNEQFKPCMATFVEIAFHYIWLKHSVSTFFFNDFGGKVIKLGLLSNTAPYCLVKHLETVEEFNAFGLLTELLLFGGVLRKDQRIESNACKFVLKKDKESSVFLNLIEYTNISDQIIRSLAVKVVLKMKQQKALPEIAANLRTRVDEFIGNRVRYHENSQHHRMLLRSLQHHLFLLLISGDSDEMRVNADWCITYLSKLPHHTSVRMCLEWYIAIYIVVKVLSAISGIVGENDWIMRTVEYSFTIAKYCIKKCELFQKRMHLNEQTITDLKLNSVPQTSLFLIIYHVTKHRMQNKRNNINFIEAEFVIETLLSYTMGQIFSTRLYAQYLACNLHKIYTLSKPENKYNYICEVIHETFKKSCSEKSYLKLCNDSYINEFDVITNLTPQAIYHHLPKYTGVADEEIADLDKVPSLDICKTCLNLNKDTIKSNIIHEYLLENRMTPEALQIYISKEITHQESDLIEICDRAVTIQKKFVPWKSMLSEIGLTNSTESNKQKSGLIVVASLIDRLPNLGGLARTCEVFGAKKYIIDSLRHVQDKQFQSLSVSAERWIDIDEVSPGNALKEYIKRMKVEGYVVVAAEQTSSSVTLDHFNFPQNTLLILGHEKEGVPCDLLPLMDHCVEIPQRGFVRSLNVHVTAAIFVWEYVKQHPIVKF